MTTARRITGPDGPADQQSDDRPGGPGPLAVLWIYVHRDLSDRRLFRAGLALDVLYGMVNLLTFLFISRVLHLPQAGQLGGAVSYFDFVAVGLAFFLVVQAACTQLVNRAQDEQRSGTLEATAALPVSAHLVALGMGIFPILLGLLRAAVYLGIAILLLGLSVDRADWTGLVIILLLGTAAALGLGIALAALAVAFGQGTAAGRVVVVALSFLSGVYFPAAVLPGPLPVLAGALPTTMTVQGLRAALIGAPWGGIAVLLALVTALLLPASTWLFRAALNRARRHGTLTRG